LIKSYDEAAENCPVDGGTHDAQGSHSLSTVMFPFSPRKSVAQH
jgi:hypothetical protein